MIVKNAAVCRGVPCRVPRKKGCTAKGGFQWGVSPSLSWTDPTCQWGLGLNRPWGLPGKSRKSKAFWRFAQFFLTNFCPKTDFFLVVRFFSACSSHGAENRSPGLFRYHCLGGGVHHPVSHPVSSPAPEGGGSNTPPAPRNVVRVQPPPPGRFGFGSEPTVPGGPVNPPYIETLVRGQFKVVQEDQWQKGGFFKDSPENQIRSGHNQNVGIFM